MIFSDSLSSATRPISKFANSITRKDGDSDSVHSRKSLAVFTSIAVMPISLGWGVVYLFVGEPIAGAIPLVMTFLTVVNLAVYMASHNYKAFEFIQFLMMILVPFSGSIALGGFVASSGTPAWLLLSPIGAAVFSTRRMAYFWFGVLVVLAVISAVIDPYLSHTNSVPGWLITVMFGMNIIGPSAVVFSLLFHFVKENQTAYRMVALERNRAESLLQNMLPAKIAARLKDGTERVADRFDEVSVLFADMVGSTELASDLPPEEMVDLLNEIFSHFDSITVRHRVEKITLSHSFGWLSKCEIIWKIAVVGQT